MPTAATLTGVGLVTSLGHDAVTAAAAARAGIVRPSLLPVWVENVETRDPEPVVGHAVEGLAAGFEGAGRLLRLAELALADLVRTTPAETLRAARWLVALPESLPSAPPPALSERDAPPAAAPAAGPPRLDPARLRALIERVTGAPVPESRFTAFDGRVGVIRALGHAQRLAEGGAACVVGALDSLVDRAAVEALHAHGRLMAGGAAVGLQPGEAAAFVVVEPEGARPALGRVGDGALGQEPDHQYSGRPALGRALATAAGQVPRGGPVWPVSDCNGEPFRGADWGHAVVRDDLLRASVGHTLYPATSVGDTGAAGPAVGLVLALRAFARGYAPAPTALLTASDALGARGVLTVHAP
jgi:3-oxoacyl-[acyl-carrier-protein] synthase-1